MASDTKTPFQRAIAEFSAAWETATRDSGVTYYRLKDGSPQWMTDAVRDAHNAIDGRLPDDWIYEHASRVADCLGEYDADDADDMRDNAHEIADGLVDSYNGARLAWLASNLGNAGIVDEAHEETSTERGDLFDQIAVGQYHTLSRIVEAVIAACDTRGDEIADAEGDDDLEECADCGGSTAEGTPDPHVCPDPA